MILTCERCKREEFELERCNYCKKMVCNSCTKSSSRYQKTTRLVICKDCWSDLKKRTAFKSNKGEVIEAKVEA